MEIKCNEYDERCALRRPSSAVMMLFYLLQSPSGISSLSINDDRVDRENERDPVADRKTIIREEDKYPGDAIASSRLTYLSM